MSDLKMPQQFPPPFPDLSPPVQTFFFLLSNPYFFFLDCFSSSSLTAVEDQASVKKEEARLQHVPDLPTDCLGSPSVFHYVSLAAFVSPFGQSFTATCVLGAVLDMSFKAKANLLEPFDPA